MTIPLSILDLSPVPEGADAATALRNTVDLARHAEHWGYKRFWVAEHHFGAVASSAPAVLIGQIAAATDTIRVGAAAVQLGQTTAVAVVEAFGMLDAFHPGRIDLGVGRSGQRRRDARRDADRPRTPKPVPPWREVDGVVIPAPFDLTTLMRNPRLRARMSVLQQPEAVAPDFADQVADILAMLAGTYAIDGAEAHAVPGEGSALIPWVFGSSKGQSARVAAAHGLPFVASYHITPATALDAVTVYRSEFRPSATLSEPYVVVSADVVVADDTETARHLASSYGHWVHSIRTGDGPAPYPDPDHLAPLSPDQRALVEDRLATQFVGDPDEVARRLHALQKVSGADELVITSVTHGHADRLRSHQLLARRWFGDVG
ncbi:alkanesulfonate monooxygenase SsuD/methylene tetrahydromethanopterin reductase-like flavin-dependent oxidoreductase (luciferase family) [Mycolicibacterium iranicum]|uniref:Alkanesulfonate monooxygenase SsuD/methylene tetrahydromethanopterin reductase-like flavin-dependent oxidoreductase (Luciferase family) n=1 Tax=Mycolicibacterium iranicum TaxID=912594 RepID=A0A839Q4K0_MYCIR|nr:LLM class flavin-dependent oxidoreductase [Mycolicibacterium iranicum]MBB2989305.1 alkanesulfonate monooxygenase SsuD/methylene tetrahydromethanopterin reductase-like flavin-dependent oxidoreductase (luciferase family) [Mycolicibacterium iranicum]